MPSAAFSALAQSASAAVDSVMAEAWMLMPCKPAPESTAAAIPDPARPQIGFLATFVDPEARPDLPNSYDRRQARRPGEDSGHSRLLVSPAARAAAPALNIRQGDLLQRQADGITWRAASVFVMAAGTLKITLNIVG